MRDNETNSTDTCQTIHLQHLFGIYKLDVHRYGHHSTIHREKSNKMQQCIKILLFHIYMRLNMFRATHRPSSGAQNCTGSLWFFIRGRLLDMWLVDTVLMMGGVSPETCWASYKCGIIKFWYTVASCWIFLYELWSCSIIWRPTQIGVSVINTPSEILLCERIITAWQHISPMILVGFKWCKSSRMVCLVTICCGMTLKRYGTVAERGRWGHFECKDGYYKQEGWRAWQ